MIWKYELGHFPTGHLMIPYPARVLDVQVQPGYVASLPTGMSQSSNVVMWVQVADTNAPPRRFEYQYVGTGTGDEVKYEEHLGTVQYEGFVWHVFGGFV